MKTVTARILRKSCLVFCQQNGIFVFSSRVINLDCQSWSINKDFLSFSDINEILVSSQYREDSLLPCLRGSQQRCHETEANGVGAWGPVRGREGQGKREETRWVSNLEPHLRQGYRQIQLHVGMFASTGSVPFSKHAVSKPPPKREGQRAGPFASRAFSDFQPELPDFSGSELLRLPWWCSG